MKGERKEQQLPGQLCLVTPAFVNIFFFLIVLTVSISTNDLSGGNLEKTL